MTKLRSLSPALGLCSALALSGCLVSFQDFPLGVGGASAAGAGALAAGGAGAITGSDGGDGSALGGSSSSAGDDSSGGGVAGSTGGSAGAATGGASDGGGGASAGQGASSGSGGSAGTMSMPPMDLMIDDFEDGDALILPNAGRSGAWFAANDGTLYAAQTPDTRGPINPSMLMPARMMSMRAMHTTGYGYKTWGAYIGASFVGIDPKEKAYDVSAHQGVQFYGKLGRANVFPGVRVAMRDYDTFVGCSNCGDNFGADITVTDAFQLIQVPFSSLKQRGWGMPLVASFDPTQAYGIIFSWDANQSFDLWIDDLSFY